MIAGSVILHGLLFTVAGVCIGAGWVALVYRHRFDQLADQRAALEHQAAMIDVRSSEAPRVDDNMRVITPRSPTMPAQLEHDNPELGTIHADLDEMRGAVRELIAVPVAMAVATLDRAERIVASARVARRKSLAAAAVMARLRAERGEGDPAPADDAVGRHVPGWVPGTAAQIAACERHADAVLVDVSMTDEITGLASWLANTHQHVIFEEISQ